MNAEQLEELEVLKSIYDGDDAFKILDDPAFALQYFFGVKDESNSFLLEFRWPADYPTTSTPDFNLNLFYNKHLVEDVRAKIVERLTSEAQNWLGSSMTFTLIEFVKENLTDLLRDQPLHTANDNDTQEDASTLAVDSTTGKAAGEKKEQMSKAQKRKMWDRGEGAGDKERGWNWVDIVKHLSQIGKAE